MLYFTIALAVVLTIVFNRTRVGLNLRAVGESPSTADAAGINVTRYKYVAACVGSMTDTAANTPPNIAAEYRSLR